MTTYSSVNEINRDIRDLQKEMEKASEEERAAIAKHIRYLFEGRAKFDRHIHSYPPFMTLADILGRGRDGNQ